MWSVLLASELARIYDLANGMPDRARLRLYVCISRTRSVTEVIGEALQLAVADQTGLTRALLEEGLSDGNIMAALMIRWGWPGAPYRDTGHDLRGRAVGAPCVAPGVAERRPAAGATGDI